ncbi:MAG TPA: formate/nitrite transporter family protein [Pyrinomonadaceae bacterium]|nr:formate/nitrite transporter family protein [Pyrinomonadaceae bacterium]
MSTIKETKAELKQTDLHDDAASNLSELEKLEAEEQKRPRAAVIHEAVRTGGEEELSRTVSSLAWSGIASGLSMGFSLVAEGLLRSYLPETHWRPLITKLGYPFGFLIVVIGRQQLYTENTLTAMLPFMNAPSGEKLLKLLRLWGVVLVANLIGALIFAWVAGKTGAFRPEFKAAFSAIGREAQGGSFWMLMLRGVFAGWLIALMAWLIPASNKSSEVVLIGVLAYVVGLAGLPHIIAGSVEVLYTIFTGETSWGAYLGHYMLPTLIGNTAGGVALVAWLNHAQVANDSDDG